MNTYRKKIINLINKIDNENQLIYLYDFISAMIELWHHKDD